MQFITAILALAATAAALPSSENWECTFGQYECAWDGDSIKQCDISGKWVVSNSSSSPIFLVSFLPSPTHLPTLPT